MKEEKGEEEERKKKVEESLGRFPIFVGGTRNVEEKERGPKRYFFGRIHFIKTAPSRLPFLFLP